MVIQLNGTQLQSIMKNSNSINYCGGGKMKYEGSDWTELSKQFGIFEKELSDDIILQRTKDYLVAKHFSDTEYLANEIRRFLNCLYEKCNGQKFNAPIWRGLLEVTDDFTLVKYTIILLEHMWY